MSREVAQKISSDEELTPLEQIYLDGFMDASALNGRKNPHQPGTPECAEYDRGYMNSLADQID